MTDTQHLEATAGPTGAGFDPGVIRAGDPRYSGLLRGMNHRFVGAYEYVCVVTSAEQARRAVQQAVAAGKRIAVRSGGQCFENFTAAPDFTVLLDMSEMTAVYYDPARRAFAIEPGATLGKVYRVLFKGWGVTVPAGECTEVGVGGHFAGGGYGLLSRRYGAVVDYIYAVEVVVVDRDGSARTVVATCEPGDPNRDLWWAHTGGGGGNFGVVTRYWVRSPGATSTDPAQLLPRAPQTWRRRLLFWPWDSMTEQSYTTLLSNFGDWFAANSGPDSPYADFQGFYGSSQRSGYGILVGASMDDGIPGAQRLMSRYFEAIRAGVGVPPVGDQEHVEPFLYTATFPGWGDPGTKDARRIKIKSAYLRRGFRPDQIAAVYRHLGGPDASPIQLLLVGYGGRVNTVAPEATATAQRDCVLKAAYLAVWEHESDDEASIGALRAFYRDVYAATGGVPVPDEVSNGSYINYPDRDLADPAWNRSGVPWQRLYYGDNYPRLQQVKLRYDPRNVFRHALSIEPPA